MVDLNSDLPAGSGWVLNEADGINNLGQVVGYGTYNGQTLRLRDVPRRRRA